MCPGLVSKWQICCLCFSRCSVETSEVAVYGEMTKVCSSHKKESNIHPLKLQDESKIKVMPSYSLNRATDNQQYS